MLNSLPSLNPSFCHKDRRAYKVHGGLWDLSGVGDWNHPYLLPTQSKKSTVSSGEGRGAVKQSVGRFKVIWVPDLGKTIPVVLLGTSKSDSKKKIQIG